MKGPTLALGFVAALAAGAFALRPQGAGSRASRPKPPPTPAALADLFQATMAEAETLKLMAWAKKHKMALLGAGEARAVFTWPPGDPMSATQVIKLAYSAYGENENRWEAHIYAGASPAVRPHLVPVRDSDPLVVDEAGQASGGKWLIMDRVVVAKKGLGATFRLSDHAGAVKALEATGIIDLHAPNFAEDGRALDYGRVLPSVAHVAYPGIPETLGPSRRWWGISPIGSKAVESKAVGSRGQGEVWTRAETFSDARQRIVDSAEFQKWFGRSAVRTPEGQPLVVYHGSTSDFTDFETFDAKRCNENAGTGVPCGTYFFSSDPDVAGSYIASMARRSGHITPAYLSLQHPLMINAHGDAWSSIAAERHLGRRLYSCLGEYDTPSINDIARFARHVEADWEPSDAGSWFSQYAHPWELPEPKVPKYDGLIVRNVRDNGPGQKSSVFTLSNTYVAFHPWQIKSAVANTTFDPKDPRIHFNRSRR